jgi:hypothetical protein
MKRTNIFKSAGTLLVAGVFATTFTACGDSEQSTYRAEEQRYETAYQTDNTSLNQPSISYQEGEYDVNQEYTYDDREVVSNRLRSDIDRADQSLEVMDRDLEQRGESIDATTRSEYEKNRESLRRERQRLNQRLMEVENSTEENWERVRNDVNNTLREWDREWEELRTRDTEFNTDTPETGTPTRTENPNPTTEQIDQ